MVIFHRRDSDLAGDLRISIVRSKQNGCVDIGSTIPGNHGCVIDVVAANAMVAVVVNKERLGWETPWNSGAMLRR